MRAATCDLCGASQASHRMDDDHAFESAARPSSYIIAVYLVDKRYGGPEEGGWWYDAGRLARVVCVVRNENRAYEYCRRLNRRLSSRRIGPNQGRRELSSVCSTGEYQAQIHEDTAPASFPERRPHYE